MPGSLLSGERRVFTLPSWMTHLYKILLEFWPETDPFWKLIPHIRAPTDPEDARKLCALIEETAPFALMAYLAKAGGEITREGGPRDANKEGHKWMVRSVAIWSRQYELKSLS